MSWLPQRWRTQRNAIRNTNCKTSWIIKTLNAHCAPRNCLGAYLSECSWTPLNKQLLLWIRKSNCLQEELGQYQGCQMVVGLCCCCCSQASAAMKFVTKSICNCCSPEWPLHINLIFVIRCLVLFMHKASSVNELFWTVHFEPAFALMISVLSVDHWVYIRISD